MKKKSAVRPFILKAIAMLVAFALSLQLFPPAQAASGIKLTNYAYPVTLSVGQSYSIKGIVSSSATIISVTVEVRTQPNGGTRKTGWTATPRAKCYNLNRIASKVKFSSLAKGTYFLRITVTTTTQKNKVILLRRFTVK